MSTSAAPTRHERRRRETADRLVEAAGHLFGERGFEATTVADICLRADVARQTFFNHFETKQDLAAELARRGHEFMLEALETARREGHSTGERIARLFREIHLAAASAGPMHQDLVSQVIRASYDTTDPARTRALQRAMQKLLRAGRAQGDVSRRHAVEDQVALVLGALEHLMFEWTHVGSFPIAERSARMARLLADALAPGAGEKTRRS